jgi:hypothetical protein
MNKSWTLMLCTAMVAVLSACGGGGGGGGDGAAADPAAAVPAAASVSVAAFVGYLKALVGADADTLEPLDVSAVTPPADDTSEPTPAD